MKGFVLTLFFTIFILQVEAQHFMKVSPDLVVTEDNKRCFLIRSGFSRRDSSVWVPFCGRFVNFTYEQGYEYTLQVDKFDPNARVIKVIKIVGRDNSENYRRQLALRERKINNDKLIALEAERAWRREKVQSQVNDRARLQIEKLPLPQFQVEEYYDEYYDYYYEYDYSDYEYDYEEDYAPERY